MARIASKWLAVWGGFLAGASAVAQLPADALLTAATTGPAAAGQAWVYVAWSASKPEVLQGRTLAVFARPADARGGGAWTSLARLDPGTPDPARLAGWVTLGLELGDGTGDLAAGLDALIPESEVTGARDVAGKLGAALALARTRPAASAALEWLGSQYHAVRFATGRAWAGKLSEGPTTLELRELDPATGGERWVVARLNLDVGSPTPLPPPGGPWVVNGRTSADDARVGLVWSVPDALRRRLPLAAGFDVWRVLAAEARANGWDATPPGAEALAAAGTKVNGLPVLPARRWTDAEALAAASDPANAFLTDAGPQGVPWNEGDEYAWFVRARDLLGFPGTSSLAGFGTVCATRSPPIPRGIEVANVFVPEPAGSPKQRLRVSWDVPGAAEGRVSRFEVFRGRGELPAIASTEELPAAWRVGTMDAAAAGVRMSWDDESLDPAADAALFGAAYWYAVRAIRDSACGPIASAPSPAVVANLRRYDAPDAPTGGLAVNCPRVVVAFEGHPPPHETLNPPQADERVYRVQVRRRDRGVAWVEVTLNTGVAGAAPLESPRLRYGIDDDWVGFAFALPRTSDAEPALVGTVVAGAFSGAVSEPTRFEVSGNPEPSLRWVTSLVAATVSVYDVGGDDGFASGIALGPFALGDAARDAFGTIVASSPDSTGPILIQALPAGAPAETAWRRVALLRPGVLAGQAGPKLVFRDAVVPEGSLPNLVRYRAWVLTPPRNGNDGGCVHVARPAGSGAVEPLLVQLTPTPRARQWRVFRTVDGGPATLIAEGVLPAGAPAGSIPVQAVDDAMPAVAARLCYFGQVADENGNWSPLGPLGCEDVLPSELPVPLLSEPQFEGDASRPVARLKWFCPPEGVNHFRIVMKPVAGDPPDQGLSAVTAPLKTVVASSPRPVSWSTEVELAATKIAAVVSTDYVTGPVGPEPMGPGPEFAYPMDVEAGMTYEVLVVAVDVRGQAGHGSRARRFRWRIPVAVVDRDVPWPQRPLPPVKALHPAMTASLLATNPMIWPATSQSNPTGVGVGAGVRIGSFFLGQRELPQDLLGLGIGENGGRLLRLFVTRSAIAAGRGFESFLYGDEMSRPPNRTFRALNVVLYREQVSNAVYPEVSGDVVQVSPLLRRLAYRVLPGGDGYEFLDPMVGLSLHLPAPAAVNQPPPRIDVHLLDLHPVVRGARYRYWVVHFDENGEPDRTIPAGDVEVAP